MHSHWILRPHSCEVTYAHVCMYACMHSYWITELRHCEVKCAIWSLCCVCEWGSRLQVHTIMCTCLFTCVRSCAHVCLRACDHVHMSVYVRAIMAHVCLRACDHGTCLFTCVRSWHMPVYVRAIMAHVCLRACDHGTCLFTCVRVYLLNHTRTHEVHNIMHLRSHIYITHVRTNVQRAFAGESMWRKYPYAFLVQPEPPKEPRLIEWKTHTKRCVVRVVCANNVLYMRVCMQWTRVCM